MRLDLPDVARRDQAVPGRITHETPIVTATLLVAVPLFAEAKVYDELRRMAHGHMAQERAGHTMQATALVNEVYLKLKNERASIWKNRAQFFAIAAQMMRRILVPAPNAAAARNK